MAINVSQPFHRTSANPVDESMALTKAQMKTVNDNLMPAYYFTVCQDDGYIYLYDKSATASAESGKFKKFEYTAGDGIIIDENDEISTDNMPAEDMSEVVSPMPSVMSRRFKYSTDEQIVGTWIDGKPVYQKTFVTTVASDSSEKAVYDVTGLNIIGVSQFRLEWHAGSDIGYIWDSRANEYSSSIDFYTRGNTLYIQITDQSFWGRELIFTFQYTKTTD